MSTIHSSPGTGSPRPESALAKSRSQPCAVVGPVFAELEPRLLMSAAGDFSIRAAGNNIILRGDRFDNHLEVTQIAAHQYQFTGLNGTTIGGLNSVIRTFTGKLTILPGAGNDSVRITEAAFNKLTINMGAGHDELIMGDVSSAQINLSGGKGSDTLFDLGANDLARRVRGFEIDRYPTSINDSFAAESQAQGFNFLLRQGRTFTINQSQTQRFITDYRIDSDARGRVRISPVYTHFITGLQGSVLANVTPDRQQVKIEARLIQTVIESVNQLGISTPRGIRYIDQPVLSTLSLDTILTLPDGGAFAPGQAERSEGPILGEASIFLQPDIVDTNPAIAQKDLQIELNVGTLHQSANSQSLRSTGGGLGTSDFSAQMQLLAGDRIDSKLSYTTERLLVSGYEATRDAQGNQTLDTFSSAFSTGLDLGFRSRIDPQRDTIDLTIDSTNALLAAIDQLKVQTSAGRKGRQFVQLPVIDSLRVQTQVTVPDGQTVVIGDIVTPGSTNPRDNMQIAITPRIVELGGSLLTEMGIQFQSNLPNSDDIRSISGSLAGGTQTLLTGQTEQLLMTDIFATFGLGGSGSMKTITTPLVTGWTYDVQTAGSIGSRITGQLDYIETIPTTIKVTPYGTIFGVQNIQQAAITTNSVSNKVPLLGDVPLVGSLFRNNETRTKTSLIIMVTPRLVNVEVETD